LLQTSQAVLVGVTARSNRHLPATGPRLKRLSPFEMAKQSVFGFECARVEAGGQNGGDAFFYVDHGVCSSAMLISTSISQQSRRLSIVFAGVLWQYSINPVEFGLLF